MTPARNMNLAPVDAWTMVHVGAGVAAGALRVPFGMAMGLAVAYEVVEQGVERTSTGQRFFGSSGPESFINAVVDVGVFALGHLIGRRL
jgi:hypothetical protein